jgi:hypothetical protein
MSNDDKGLIGAIIYWILVLLFIRILFQAIRSLYYWMKKN